jgi:glycosyltransferase involved in cell wall biosynthesis
MTSGAPVVSAIVCTYNRRRMLSRALESLCRQSTGPARYDIIVVDNNSRDDTRAYVEDVARRYPNVRYALEMKQGLSHARNCGAEIARSEYLLYMDDDAIAPSEYFEQILSLLDMHKPDILGGPIYPYYLAPKPRWFRDEWEIRRYAKQSGFATIGGISGSNYVIRKDVLKQLGMFDPSLGMRGDELGLGEDRKVLETYRNTVPLEKQRVYYALECPMLHLTPAVKLRPGYLARRHFAAGRLAVTVKGRGQTFGEAMRSLGRLPRAVYVKHLNVRDKGWAGVDPVEAIRRCIFEFGLLYEAFRQMALRSAARKWFAGKGVIPDA